MESVARQAWQVMKVAADKVAAEVQEQTKKLRKQLKKQAAEIQRVCGDMSCS